MTNADGTPLGFSGRGFDSRRRDSSRRSSAVEQGNRRKTSCFIPFVVMAPKGRKGLAEGPILRLRFAAGFAGERGPFGSWRTPMELLLTAVVAGSTPAVAALRDVAQRWSAVQRFIPFVAMAPKGRKILNLNFSPAGFGLRASPGGGGSGSCGPRRTPMELQTSHVSAGRSSPVVAVRRDGARSSGRKRLHPLCRRGPQELEKAKAPAGVPTPPGLERVARRVCFIPLVAPVRRGLIWPQGASRCAISREAVRGLRLGKTSRRLRASAPAPAGHDEC